MFWTAQHPVVKDDYDAEEAVLDTSSTHSHSQASLHSLSASFGALPTSRSVLAVAKSPTVAIQIPAQVSPDDASHDHFKASSKIFPSLLFPPGTRFTILARRTDAFIGYADTPDAAPTLYYLRPEDLELDRAWLQSVVQPVVQSSSIRSASRADPGLESRTSIAVEYKC
jgi:hypothetical protein